MVDSSNLLVVTCAGGRQCNHLLPLLYGKYNLRLVVQSESSRDRLAKQYPNANVIQADIAIPEACKQVLHEASHVFHIGPSLHPRELEIGLNMIDAAVYESKQPNHKFKHFIYSSVLNTQFRKMFNHDRKRYVEEYLFETDLNYTVLNPGDFLNLAFPVKFFASMAKPQYRCPMGLESKSAFVVLEDYAEACEKVIREGEKHYMAQYQMVSMRPIAYSTVAEDVGKALKRETGKDFPISQLTLEEGIGFLCDRLWTTSLQTSPPRQLDGAERLILFYRRRGLQGNPNTMEWLLERKPTSHIDWIVKQLKD